MIIVHVTNSVMSGGVGTMIRALVFEQYKAGNIPIVLSNGYEHECFKAWCKLKGIDVPFYPIEKYRLKKMTVTGGLSKKMYSKIMRLGQNEKIVFHFHNPISVGFFSYIPSNSVCTLHGFIGKVSNNVISNKIALYTIKRMIKKDVKMVGCCNAVADYFNSKFKVKCFFSVLNGIEEYEKGINKYINQSSKIKIGFASHIDELKGWRIIKDAYQLMSDAQKDKCEFYFAGTLSEEDESSFEKFCHHTNIHYIGYINDAKENFIPYLDVLLLPSRTEGLPMCLLEAMQHNVIVIATEVGGIGEIVESGKSGILIKRNGEALCDILVEIIENPRLFSNLKRNSAITFRNKGTAKSMQDRYMKVYSEL